MKRRAYVLALVIAGACAAPSTQPTRQLNTANLRVERARAIGAQNDPRAAMHLKIARDHIAVAKQQIAEGDNHAAAHNLVRAAYDAELAEILARESQSERQAVAMERRLQARR